MEAKIYGNDRKLTKEERLWATRLLRCLNAMPNDIEIEVFYTGNIDMRILGTRNAYVDDNMHSDNVPCLHTITPKTAHRITGADHVI